MEGMIKQWELECSRDTKTKTEGEREREREREREERIQCLDERNQAFEEEVAQLRTAICGSREPEVVVASVRLLRGPKHFWDECTQRAKHRSKHVTAAEQHGAPSFSSQFSTTRAGAR